MHIPYGSAPAYRGRVGRDACMNGMAECGGSVCQCDDAAVMRSIARARGGGGGGGAAAVVHGGGASVGRAAVARRRRVGRRARVIRQDRFVPH